MLRIAVDVGGTFTDVVASDDRDSSLFVVKIRSTPIAPEEGFLSAVDRILAENKLPPSAVSDIVHVGTIATNLFFGQIGLQMPRAALITTKGFRDILEIGRQNRPELYNIFFRRPVPLIPRRLRLEVEERVYADGTVATLVSRDDLNVSLKNLSEQGIEAVAVSFINSYVNAQNELDAKRILSDRLRVPIFISSEIDPEHREYERTSTTVVNTVLAPVVSKYLDSAMKGLQKSGVNCGLQVLSSSGGLVDLEEVKHRPIMAIESGPAAGVVGAAEIARMLGFQRMISLDMGGTTAKAGCVVNYVPLVVPEVEVGGRVHMGRMIKGSGYPVRYPSIDLAEVSAGGGTIVWADDIGGIKVGPISAGASPGPACYDKGGQNPTVTDANLVLGRINSVLLNGELRLNPSAAEKALNHVSEKVGLDMWHLAAAALKLVNLQMARAVDIVSLERGLDPRDFRILAFGGAGPMHAVELAEEVGVRTIVVPPWPGLFSALSMLMSDHKYTYVRGLLKPLDELLEGYLENQFQSMTNDALLQLNARGIDGTKATLDRSIDLRYMGQGYELEVTASTPFIREEVAEAFEKKHEAVYGYKHLGERLEVTALRLTVTLPAKKMILTARSESHCGPRQALTSKRKAWFNDQWIETPVYQRDLLPVSHVVEGPAIVEAYDSTIVVCPHWNCKKNDLDCLILSREGK